MEDQEDKPKDTKKGYKFYTYLNEEQMNRVRKYVKDNYSTDELESALVRIMLMKLLSDAGY